MILRPLINEKSMALVKSNFYTFEISKSVGKRIIGRIIEDKFKVDVLSVQIVNLHSKVKVQRTRKGFFKTRSSKKAIVKIKKGQRIPIFETLSEEENKEEVTVRTAEGEPVTTVKEKKSLLKGTKVKIEKEQKEQKVEGSNEKIGKGKRTRQQSGKAKGK